MGNPFFPEYKSRSERDCGVNRIVAGAIFASRSDNSSRVVADAPMQKVCHGVNRTATVDYFVISMWRVIVP
jgi:hypothetical protein